MSKSEAKIEDRAKAPPIQLMNIKKSDNPKKKMMAIFKIGENRYMKVHFGTVGYQDYTMYMKAKSEDANEAKRLYKLRHANDNLADLTSPGALSWNILWNKPTITESIQEYKTKFAKYGPASYKRYHKK
jgi:hypothetical protein